MKRAIEDKHQGKTLNKVLLEGKISRTSGLRYSPSGVASLRFTLAVSQKLLDKSSMGYFEVIVFGKDAELKSQLIRVGETVAITGQLWSRTFRNGEGIKLSETKVIADGFNLENSIN